MKYWPWIYQSTYSGLDLNFQDHLSLRKSEIENSHVLHELTPVRAIISVIMLLIIDLSCRTSVIIIQPVREAIFQNLYLSGTVRQSLRSSPDIHQRKKSFSPLTWAIMAEKDQMRNICSGMLTRYWNAEWIRLYNEILRVYNKYLVNELTSYKCYKQSRTHWPPGRFGSKPNFSKIHYTV